MRRNLIASTATVMFSFVLPFAVAVAHADDDNAGQQLHDANDAGQDAVNSSTDEGAHDAASQVFDTPAQTPVDTTTPSEGSSGLSNAPTYDPNSSSGLSNAPTP